MKISDIYGDDDRTIEVFGRKFHWPLPLVAGLHGSGAIVFGRRVYGGGKDRPIVDRLHTAFEAISDFKYALMYRFLKRHQYHVIHTDLGYGYHCSDSRILHGAMKCLEEYVEAGKHSGEKGLEEHVKEMRANPDPNAPEGLVESCADSDAEALAIYRWWKYKRPEEHKYHSELLMRAYGDDKIEWKTTDNPKFAEAVITEAKGEEKKALRKEYQMLEEKMDADDQTHLHRLITIRRSLWI